MQRMAACPVHLYRAIVPCAAVGGESVKGLLPSHNGWGPKSWSPISRKVMVYPSNMGVPLNADCNSED